MFRRRSPDQDAQAFADSIVGIRFVPLAEFTVASAAGDPVAYAIRWADCDRQRWVPHGVPRGGGDAPASPPGERGYHLWERRPYRAKVLVRAGAVLTSRHAAAHGPGDRYIAHPAGCRDAEPGDLAALAGELDAVRTRLRDIVRGEVIHGQRAGRGPDPGERDLLRLRLGLS